MDKPILVIDTNILVSSIFWSGNPYLIIQKGINQSIIIFTSNKIIDELRIVLKREFHLAEQEIEDIVNALMLFLHLTKTSEKIDIIKEDETDNIVLECAVSCKADYIVSGDGHLLNLKEYNNIKILSARNFLDLFK